MMTGELRMSVRVRDTAAETRRWGSGVGGPIVRRVSIARHCRVCGGRRGPVRSTSYRVDGEWITVDQWDNPCGHIDMYEACISEAEALAERDARVDAWRSLLTAHLRDGAACACGHPTPSIMHHLDHLAIVVDLTVQQAAVPGEVSR